MNFGEAIESLKCGQRVARGGWNGRGMYLALQVPDEHSKMTQPYIYIKPIQDDLIPWLASQADMLAEPLEPTLSRTHLRPAQVG